MDLQVALICGVVVVVIVSLLTLTFKYGFKSESYEEALQVQRKLATSLLGPPAKIKSNKEKKLKKAEKRAREKAARQGDNKSEDQQVASTDDEAKTVKIAENPIILTTPDHPPVKQQFESRSKTQMRSILMSRDKSPINVEGLRKANASDSPLISNKFEQIVPKDEKELFKLKEQSVKNTKNKISVNVPDKTEKKKKDVERLAEDEAKQVKVKKDKSKNDELDSRIEKKQEDKQLSKPIEKKNNSKNDGKMTNIPVESNVDPIVAKPLVIGGDNRHEEVNSVARVDEVKNQKIAPQVASPIKEKKKKKNELYVLQQLANENNSALNINALMPFLEKCELSRMEVQIVIDMLLNKQQDTKDIKQEWCEGRSDPVLKLKKQLAEREKALRDEQDAHQGVAIKMREVRNELVQRIQVQRQLEETNNQLQAERQSILIKLQQISNEQNNERKIHQQQLKQMQVKIGKMQDDFMKKQDENNQLQMQLQSLEVALQQQQQENKNQLENQLAVFQQEQQNLNAVVTQLTNELTVMHERNAHFQNIASQVDELARQNDELRHTCNELEQHLNANKINLQLKSEECKRAEDSRIKSHMETERLRKDLHAQMQMNKDDSEKSIAELREQLQHAQQIAECAHAERDQQHEVVVLNLKNELARTNANLEAVQRELDASKAKNDEIVNKTRLTEQKNQREFLKRLLPHLQIDETLDYEQYLQQYQGSVQSVLNGLNPETRQRLETEIEKQQEMIAQLNRMCSELKLKMKDSCAQDEKVDSVNEKLSATYSELEKLENLRKKDLLELQSKQEALNNLEAGVKIQKQIWEKNLAEKEEEIKNLKIVQTQLEELRDKLNAEQTKNSNLAAECNRLKSSNTNGNSEPHSNGIAMEKKILEEEAEA